MNEPPANLPPVDAEVWSLVESFVDGTATADECRRLQTLLRNDESARQFYVAYLDLHAQLQWRTRGKSDRAAPATVALAPAGPIATDQRKLIWSSLVAISALATAAAVFLMISLPRRGPE